jgi:hypothetical protein
MGNESDKSPQVPETSEPAKKNNDPQKKFFWEVVEQQWPIVKLIRAYIRREGKAIWDGWMFFGILALLGGCFTCSLGYEWGTKKLETVRKDDNKQIDTLAGQLKDAKQERDKNQLLLAPFQAMAIQVYTNVPIDKRLEYFTSQFLSFKTNLLTEIESERPSFQLYNDNILITNGAVISIKKDRTVKLNVRNASKITAEQLKILVIAPAGIATTNFIGGAFWNSSEVGMYSSADARIAPTELLNGWEWVAQIPFAGYTI